VEYERIEKRNSGRMVEENAVLARRFYVPSSSYPTMADVSRLSRSRAPGNEGNETQPPPSDVAQNGYRSSRTGFRIYFAKLGSRERDTGQLLDPRRAFVFQGVPRYRERVLFEFRVDFLKHDLRPSQSSTVRCVHVAFNAARGTVNGSYSRSSLASDGNRLGADNRSTHANVRGFSGPGTSATTFAVFFLPYARRFTLISIWRPVNDGGSFFSLSGGYDGFLGAAIFVNQSRRFAGSYFSVRFARRQ